MILSFAIFSQRVTLCDKLNENRLITRMVRWTESGKVWLTPIFYCGLFQNFVTRLQNKMWILPVPAPRAFWVLERRVRAPVDCCFITCSPFDNKQKPYVHFNNLYANTNKLAVGSWTSRSKIAFLPKTYLEARYQRRWLPSYDPLVKNIFELPSSSSSLIYIACKLYKRYLATIPNADTHPTILGQSEPALKTGVGCSMYFLS